MDRLLLFGLFAMGEVKGGGWGQYIIVQDRSAELIGSEIFFNSSYCMRP